MHAQRFQGLYLASLFHFLESVLGMSPHENAGVFPQLSCLRKESPSPSLARRQIDTEYLSAAPLSKMLPTGVVESERNLLTPVIAQLPLRTRVLSTIWDGCNDICVPPKTSLRYCSSRCDGWQEVRPANREVRPANREAGMNARLNAGMNTGVNE